MSLSQLKSTLGELRGEIETFSASCTSAIGTARGEVDGVLAGVDSEIQGIKSDINGAIGRAVALVDSLDQELVALEP